MFPTTGETVRGRRTRVETLTRLPVQLRQCLQLLRREVDVVGVLCHFSRESTRSRTRRARVFLLHGRSHRSLAGLNHGDRVIGQAVINWYMRNRDVVTSSRWTSGAKQREPTTVTTVRTRTNLTTATVTQQYDQPLPRSVGVRMYPSAAERNAGRDFALPFPTSNAAPLCAPALHVTCALHILNSKACARFSNATIIAMTSLGRFPWLWAVCSYSSI